MLGEVSYEVGAIDVLHTHSNRAGLEKTTEDILPETTCPCSLPIVATALSRVQA